MALDYVPHSLTLTQAAASPVLPASDMGNPFDIETIGDASGAATQLTRTIARAGTRLTASVEAVDRALAVLAAGGTCIKSDGVLRGVTACWRAVNDCGDTPVGVNSHATRTAIAGLVVPRQLTGGRNETVKLSLEVFPIVSGLNAALAISNAAALPAFATADLSQYVVAAVKVAGVVYTDVRSLTLDFGNQLTEPLYELDDVQMSNIGVLKHAPFVEFNASKLDRIGDGAGGTIDPLAGAAATHAATEIWLRRRLNQSALAPPASAVHIKLTMAGLLTSPSGGESSGGGVATTGFRLHSIDDGVNAPIVQSLGVQYTPPTND